MTSSRSGSREVSILIDLAMEGFHAALEHVNILLEKHGVRCEIVRNNHLLLVIPRDREYLTLASLGVNTHYASFVIDNEGYVIKDRYARSADQYRYSDINKFIDSKR